MNEEQEQIAKLCDMIRRTENGAISATGFLSPEYQGMLSAYLERNAPRINYICAGGFPEAERRMIVLFPDYLEREFIDVYDLSEYITPLFIRPGGYVKLDHRSYMGAVLGCGITRSALGDIVLTDGGAVVFMQKSAADYILSYEQPLTGVGRDKVKVSVADAKTVSGLKREYEEVVFNVASCRIDALASEIAGISREKIKEVIDRGDVRVNCREVTDRTARFAPGDVISVRGRGKYIIKELQETRKGRQRVLALKYK